jgi:CRISPR-associated protein Cas1
MSRPRCDPFDISALRKAIEAGETTERAAYLAYASTAARPYARSTFTVMLKATTKVEAEPIGVTNNTGGKSPLRPGAPCELAPARAEETWREKASAKPRILSLAAGGGLRVQRAALVAFDASGPPIRYTPASKPPSAIVLSSAGGFVSIEAVRWCARRGVAIIALDRAHSFLSVMTGAGHADARRLRAQVEADPARIARALVTAKIEALAAVGGLGGVEARAKLAALGEARSVEEVRNVEAQAARIAWATPCALRFERGPVPADWNAPWLARTRLDAATKRGARHPINAMLNAAFSVTAGRLCAYLAAAGFAPAIGFLHADKRGRHSLAWDAIEPMRPAIEARIFALVERERFRTDDFERDAESALRLAPACLRLVLNEAAPPASWLTRCVKRMAGLIEGEAALAQADHAAGFLIHHAADAKRAIVAGKLGGALEFRDGGFGKP